ncbi:MAG: 6-bladed beta-propeller [Bacteroidetes bacterium]|nr:6-bladed beta-propeller [Bacteroidota bacterium]
MSKVISTVLIFCLIVGCRQETGNIDKAKSLEETFLLVSELELDIEALGSTLHFKEHVDGFLIMDASERLIYLFGEDGTLQNTIGGRGDGPGEFEVLSSVATGERGNVYAYDLAKFTLFTFNPNGELLQRIKMPPEYRSHELDYADGLLYSYSGFTHPGLSTHISVVEPETGIVVNEFMEPSVLYKEVRIPYDSTTLNQVSIVDGTLIVTHPLELIAYFYDLEGNLINYFYGESPLFVKPDDSYSTPEPLHTAFSALIFNTFVSSQRVFIEFQKLSKNGPESYFLEIYGHDGSKLNDFPISLGDRSQRELIHVTKNSDLLVLERATGGNRPVIKRYRQAEAV